MDIRVKFNIPDGAAATFVERFLQMAFVETAIWVCAGLAHSRDQGLGWKKTLLLYTCFVAWQVIVSPVAEYLGADLYSNSGTPSAVGPVFWPKAILMYIVFCRALTSTLEALRCPAAVQVGALTFGYVVWHASARLSSYGSWDGNPDGWYPARFEVLVEPEAPWFAQHGMQWLAAPPFWGNILIGRVRFDWWMVLAYNFSYHYIRRIGLHLSRICTWPRHAAVVAVFGAIVAIYFDHQMSPFNNLTGEDRKFKLVGTPHGAQALLLEIAVVCTAVSCLLVTFYVYPCRPLAWLGMCTFPAFVTHAFVIEKAPRLIRSLPRAPGSWEPASALFWLFAVVLSYIVLSGACFHLGLTIFRALWTATKMSTRDACAAFEALLTSAKDEEVVLVTRPCGENTKYDAKSDDGVPSISSTADTLSVRSA
jgi:hypothetical protein